VKRPAVDVCFTPLEIRPVEVAVVVDVLRATSTIVQALAVGYPRVVCCKSVATARELRAPGRVLAGESACVRLRDFELGNSPAAMATVGRRGEELVLATTNGSPAVVAASRAAERVLVGCLLNLRAVLAAVSTDERVASGYGSPLEPLAASEDAAQLRATGPSETSPGVPASPSWRWYPRSGASRAGRPLSGQPELTIEVNL
jgi:phosphosulfolactate phosphohydrolase-like enzyme